MVNKTSQALIYLFLHSSDMVLPYTRNWAPTMYQTINMAPTIYYTMLQWTWQTEFYSYDTYGLTHMRPSTRKLRSVLSTVS